MAETVLSQQGEMLDALLWRRFGHLEGHLEATLEANPHLARLGAVLPMGTPVYIPDPPLAKPKRFIRLWGEEA